MYFFKGLTLNSQCNLFILSFTDFDVGTGGLSAGAIAGIVIGSCAFVGLILAVLWWRGYIGGDKEDKGKHNIQVGSCYKQHGGWVTALIGEMSLF